MDDYVKTTPDFYATNHGIDVEQEQRYPESGRIRVGVHLSQYQSTILQFGLEQAKELHSKLGAIIEEIEGQ